MSRDNWQDQEFAADWDETGNLFTNPDRLRQLALLADCVLASKATRLLDLGIGSAQVESAINRRHPEYFARCQVTGIDASEAMLALARQRCTAEQLAGVRLLREDFSSIDKLVLDQPADAAICVQALHEVAHETKRVLFAWVRQQLAPGAPFFILDRFDYPMGDWLDDWRATWDWMRSSVAEEVLDFDDYHRRYLAKTDHLATVENYCSWLQQAGFETLCPYRCFNRAMIIARARPG